MKGLINALSFVALAGFMALIVTHRAGDVLSAVAGVGWQFGFICLLQLIPLILHTAAWATLLPRSVARPFGNLLLFRWYGESVTSVLPITPIGGDILRGHLHERTGASGPVAIGAVIVDLTTEVAGQLAFAVVALAILILRGRDAGTAPAMIATLTVLSVFVFGFYLAQRRALFGGIVRVITGLAGISTPRGAAYAQALDRAIRRLYLRQRHVWVSCVLHFLAWASGALQLYAAAALVGHRIDRLDALMLEGLITALRAAAFMVPAALGVQEGGFILLGSLIGIPPEMALSLSVIRRVRELLLGIPGALLWRTIGVPKWAAVINR